MIATHRGRLVVDLKYRHPSGRVERVRVVAPQSRRAAEKLEREILAELRAGTYSARKEETTSTPEQAPTIATYADIYVKEHSASCGLRKSSIKSKRGHLAKWIVPVLGDRSIDRIRSADFTRLRVTLHDAELEGKTINNVLSTLSSLVKFWHEQHDLPRPSFKAGLVKLPKSSRAPYYTEEDLAKLITAASEISTEDLLLVMLPADAGLRMSECRALCRGDVYATAKPEPYVSVERTRDDGEGDVDEEDEEHSPKGWDVRAVPLTGRLVEALRQHPRHLQNDHLFVDSDGQPLTRRMVARRFEAVQRRASVKHGTYHWLRHSFATHLAARGVHVTVIQALMGHKRVETTMRYIHLVEGATGRAIAALDRGTDLVHGRGSKRKRSARVA